MADGEGGYAQEPYYEDWGGYGDYGGGWGGYDDYGNYQPRSYRGSGAGDSGGFGLINWRIG